MTRQQNPSATPPSAKPSRWVRNLLLIAAACSFGCIGLTLTEQLPYLEYAAGTGFCLTLGALALISVHRSDVVWKIAAGCVIALTALMPLMLPPEGRVGYLAPWALGAGLAQLVPMAWHAIANAPSQARFDLYKAISIDATGDLPRTNRPFLLDQFAKADWKSETAAVIGIVIAESFLPMLLAAVGLVGFAYALAHTNQIADWIARLAPATAGKAPDSAGPSKGVSPGLAIALISSLVQAARVIVERSRRRNAVCSAIATELRLSLKSTVNWADFDGLRAWVRDHPGIRPLIVAEARPFLFLHPTRQELIDLHGELFAPVVKMLDADHDLSKSYAQLNSDAFATASQERRERFTQDVIDLAHDDYFPAAREALYKLMLYIEIRCTMII